MAYDESSIQHLTGVAALRAKPQMYIGPTDAHGLFTLLREVGDNGVDEALAGHCSRIGIVIDDSSGDRIYTVVDDGRGMPVGDMSVKDSVTGKSVRLPAIQAITSLLHAGGKLSRGDGDSAYRVSIGCFAPEVRIRLLDDTVVTFEELHRRWTKNKRPIPVLSYNTKKKRLEPSEITFSQITKRTRHLVEVEFDNGHTVRVTPNHPFYVRKGGSVKAVPAGRLKEGDSLVSTYYPDVESGVHRGYAHATEDGRTKVLHRLVGSFDPQTRRFNELEANTHVHHKNKNTRDSRPSNLEVLSTADPNLGIDLNECSDDVVSDAMFSWNHSVAAVREVTLDSPIPVYDITVDHTHTFFIEAGPGRLGKRLAPSSGVLVSNSHGVGIKATNFLSSWFRVFTFNKGAWWKIEYQEGELSVPLTKLSKPPRDPIDPSRHLKSGTVVSFQPNLSFFSASKFPPSMLAEWATMKAYFTPGLTLDVKIRDKLITLHFPDGVSQYITDRVADLKVEVNGEPFAYSSPLVDCLFTFSSFDGCEMSAFTNGLQNLDRGTHFDTFFKTLMEVVTPLAPKTKDGKLPFTVAELREGMIGVVNIKLSSPQFGGQTKEKLVDTRGQEPLAEDLKGPLAKWVKANGPLLKSVIEKAIRLKELKGKFAVSKTAISKIRAAGKKGFSPKAAIALNCSSDKRELFLVEGDSALGCFLGDTKVRLINGVSVRFDEMADRAERGEVFYGYAYDRKAETAAVIKFDTPRLTKHVTEYAEVELSTGEILRCTLDHPWLTRDNTYVAAADLQAGQSLMTFAEEKEDGRRIVVVPMRGNRFPGRKRFVYDLVARLKKKNRFLLDSGDGYQVHHKDHDRSNDHPSNLEVITTAAHLLEHYDERVATEGVKAVGIRHARRLETDPAYLRRCQEHSSELMSEFWSRSENRVAQSQRIKEHYQKAGSRRATSLATSAGMRGVWLALAARCSDPFDDAEFESVKLQLGTRTVLRAKSWSRYFKSKREAMRHILQVIRATNG